jgi:hypothetical protein
MLTAPSLRRTARKIPGLRATGMITDAVLETTRHKFRLTNADSIAREVGL